MAGLQGENFALCLTFPLKITYHNRGGNMERNERFYPTCENFISGEAPAIITNDEKIVASKRSQPQ